jgi:hypothetical protein
MRDFERRIRKRPTAVLLGVVVVALAVVRGGTAARGDGPAVPSASSTRVFTSGVPGGFEALKAAIAQAKETSGRDYRVVIVDAAGEAGDARGLLDRITTRWREEAGGSGGFDASADVTIVVDAGDRQIAMLVPWGVEVGSGLDAETLQRELIEKVFVPRAKDGLYDEGLAELVTATERWVRERADEKQARAEAARVFRTRTLPLGVAGLAGAGALAALGLQWARHQRRVAAARQRLAAFKQEVVALSDLLDAQQERHRMLPHNDPDFKTPMEGLTRAAYDNVQGAIARYRERWLGLMDVWEHAEEKIGTEWFLGTAAADETIRLLDSAEARPPLEAVAGECRGPLDALEGAHEKARELLAAIDADSTTARGRLDGLAKRGRSGGTLEKPLAAVARIRERAAAELERDPVAARGALEEAAGTLTGMLGRLDAIEGADDRRLRAAARGDEIVRQIGARRTEGWLLAEPGANPDDRIASARHDCGLAAQLLDAGETDAALACVERAEQANAEAATLLESIVAARAKVDELLPACGSRLESLAAGRDAAAAAVERLAAGYAESSWADVAENVPKADEGIQRVRTLLLEARAAADPTRQEYFRAVALLEEAVRQEDWIEGSQAAITDRLTELDQLRGSLPPRRDAVAERIDALENRLRRQQTDRVRANERCREAGRILEVADGRLAAERPDLLQAGQLIEAADTTATRAEQFAEEDDRLARQAAGDLEETDSLLRRVAAWYAEGVQADVRGAASMLETAKSLLARQRYEESIKASGEAGLAARAAYAAATAEAERRRLRRQQEIQRRQLEDSFARMSRGAGPWVISLPGGGYTGPDPWRSLGGGPRVAAPPRSAGGGWSRDIAQVGW